MSIRMSDIALPAASESCRPSLTSLPSELLTLIALNLAPRDAASFARVARAFTVPSEPALWRDLSLTLSEHFGRLPMPCAYDPETPYYEERERSEAVRVEERHRRAIMAKVDTVLALANERRWSYVRSVRLVPRPEPVAIAGMVRLLDLVSPRLRELELLEPGYGPHGEPSRIWTAEHDYETLDHALLSANLSFPNLDHLRVVGKVLYSEDVIPLLCGWAPNARVVEINYDPYRTSTWRRSSKPSGKLFETDTKIKALRLALRDLFHVDSTQASYQPTRVLISLIEHSPHLCQLDLSYFQRFAKVDLAYHRLVSIFKGLDELRDLCWRVKKLNSCPQPWSVPTTRRSKETSGDSLGIRRFCFVDTVEWVDIFTNLPSLPNLETLLIATKTGRPPTSPLCDDLPTYTLPLEEDIANQIRRCPNLVTMHHTGGFVEDPEIDIFSQFDKHNYPAGLAGRVSSLRYGDGDELLHVYAYLPQLPRILDEAGGPGEDVPGRWEYLTDWQGYTVPIEVISRMRRISGIKDDEEWYQRGVVVGPRAWEVLWDWHQSVDYGMGGNLFY